MDVVFIIIFSIYSGLILALIIGFLRSKKFSVKQENLKISFSILIPFRNEERNMEKCIRSLSNLNYPDENFEILLIDDHSTDRSREIAVQVVDKMNLKNIRIVDQETSKSGKKNALDSGISKSNFSYIITSDADCSYLANWLQSFNSFLQRNDVDLLAGGIQFEPRKSLVHYFQSIELISLQMATMGSFGLGFPILCNGANLCFKKSSFMAVGGYEGNEHIASGDDVLLLYKFIEHGKKTSFLKSTEAVVNTSSEKRVIDLLKQRKRWSKKSKNYTNLHAKFITALIGITNISVILGLVLVSLSLLELKVFLAVLILKFAIDLIYLLPGLNYYGIWNLIPHYCWSFLVYPFFVTVVFLMSFQSGYRWKGRQHKL